MMGRVPPLFIALILLLTTLSCSRNNPSSSKEVKQDLKTYKVTSSEVLAYIEATGSVQPDLEGTSKILPQLAGTISQIYIKIGNRVKQGDPLVGIKSPEITDAYSNYLSILTQLKQAERIYNLNKQLFEIGAVTKNDLLNSESTYKQFSALAEGQKSKLNLFGFSTDDDSLPKNLNRIDTFVIKAPLNGYVADIQTHVGDKVDTSTPLMTLANPGKIVVVANIYDTDIPRVKKGSNVTFYVDTFPDVPFKGVITYVSDISDIESKTVKTFIKILDRKDMFKQNMFLKIKIEGDKKLLPLIPQSAMVYREGKFYVYDFMKDGKHILKEIKPIKEVPGKFMAVEGVADGEEIVLSAIELEKP